MRMLASRVPLLSVTVLAAVMLVLLTTSISAGAFRIDSLNRRITRAKAELSSEQQIEAELDEALRSLESLESESNSDTETNTDTATATEVDSEAENKAGNKRYEGIEHMVSESGDIIR